MAILAATHAVRSLRAGVSYPGEQSFAIPAWEFAAENPPVMSELMSSMIDGGLPPLAKPDANVAAPVWGRYMRLIAQKAKAATQTVAAQQAEAQPDGAAARKRRATQAATDAKTAAEGKGPKPA